ncbi:MAG: hypothetical protein ACFFCZ_05045 [Promethearchaeota archaeon]
MKTSKMYHKAFQSASSLIRRRDFVHYLPVVAQPTDLGNESWAFIWAAIRYYDDLTDEQQLTFQQKDDLHVDIWDAVQDMYNNSFDVTKTDNDLMKWLSFYIQNDVEYEFGTYKYLRLLYESNIEDHERGRDQKIYTNKQLSDLIHKKAACFIKVMYSVGLGINDVLCEHLGRALQIVDDIMDMKFDLSVGQINITKEDMNKFELDLDSPDLLSQLHVKGFFNYRATQILQHIKIARNAAMNLANIWTKKFTFMATELLAAPILENRLRPGGKYYVKGGRILNSLLPNDEKRAYRLGYRLIKMLYRFLPQCNQASLNKSLLQLPEIEPCI